MTRNTPKNGLSILCCSVFLAIGHSPSFAQVARLRLPGGASGVSAGAAVAGAASSLPTALTAAPALMASPLAASAALPSIAPAPTAVPAAVAAPVAAPAPRSPALAAAPLRAAAADAPQAPQSGSQRSEEDDAQASRHYFDQVGAAAESAAVPAASDGAPLHQLYPKAVFIQDVFNGPAPDSVAAYVNRLVDAGVHVVFLTWRPQKGAGSADEILLSRVKQSRNNPVVVVAFNGGKIALHGRAANPKAIIENMGQFSAEDLAAIRAMAAKAAGESAQAEVNASPADNEAFSLTIKVSGAERASVLRSLNAQMKRAGLPYKAETHPDDAASLIIHSMPLRFSLPRVIDALESQFPGEGIAAQPEKYLVIADSMRSLRFATAFPKLSEVQVAGDGAAVSAVLGATLGDRKLETVSIKLGKLRQYAEYWEPSRRYVPAPGARNETPSFGGRTTVRPQDRETSQMLSMFVGTVINRLMASVYENIRNGQHQFAATPWALQKQLEAMWRKPVENGVYVNKKLAQVLARIPGDVRRGYLERASAFVSNFYARELANYPSAAAHVELNLVSLNTDRKSAITLEFKSSATGKIYKIHTRIPRVMRQRTGEGVTMTAYAYRTGKETADEGEEFLSRLYAMALLKGHARKGPDGKWHHGSPEGAEITKLVVQFERHSSARIKVYAASEFDALEEGGMIDGPIVREITSAIERMEADAEYQQYYREHEEEATKEDLKKPASPKKKAAKKPVAKKTAAKKAPQRKGAK